MPSADPTFKPIFGESWQKLPPVIHKHYANRPYSTDKATVEGTLDIMCKWYMKPIFWLCSSIPTKNAKNVPVTVHFSSSPTTSAFHLNRIFHIDPQNPYHFRSSMTHVQGDEVMERMRYGICWHSHYYWDGEKVVLRHKGYSLHIAWRYGFTKNITIPLPITWLIGRSDAYERPIDANTFAMCATIRHALLGKLYEYKGQFMIAKEVE